MDSSAESRRAAGQAVRKGATKRRGPLGRAFWMRTAA